MTINFGDLRRGVSIELDGQPWEVRLPTDLVKLDNSLVIN